jgi:hypothetical protein
MERIKSRKQRIDQALVVETRADQLSPAKISHFKLVGKFFHVGLCDIQGSWTLERVCFALDIGGKIGVFETAYSYDRWLVGVS